MLYNIARGLVHVVFALGMRVKVFGKENVPKEGAFILAVNHKSNLDPPMAAVYCPRRLTFMAKEELFEHPVFGGLIRRLGAFPIQRGKGDIGAIKSAFSILRSGNVMLIFPQGHRMKNGQRGKAQMGVAMIAQKMQVPVIPMCISGEYKFMGKIRVTFGEPIEFSQYNGQRLDSAKLQELADEVLDAILQYDTEGKTI